MKIYLALIHYPIRNKLNEEVVTSVTNLDIHDISRSCRTYDVENFYIVTPLKAQIELVNRILGHWSEDKSNAYNPDRSDALKNTFVIESFESAKQAIFDKEQKWPFVVATGANFKNFSGSAADLKVKMELDNSPILLIFGTGWGLHNNLLEKVDYHLKPLYGASRDGYNHLSVRSAVAIYLDQLKS